jgi:hypothetical protein
MRICRARHKNKRARQRGDSPHLSPPIPIRDTHRGLVAVQPRDVCIKAA